MLIESIHISNFRQFYGSIDIEMSTEPGKNITVVHGANGSGKTSLLNAFKWCFYGVTDFDTFNEHILNEAAIEKSDDGEIIALKVSVKFQHENRRYGATRSQKFVRLNGIKAESITESEFTLDITGDDGQTLRSRNPNLDLRSILPLDLQPYFFFNGERIEHIAGVNQGVQIQEAIRKLMGLELVDRAVEHVGRVKNEYRNFVRNSAGLSEEQKELHDLIQRLEEEKQQYDDDFLNAKREESLAKNKITDIERQLKKFEKSRDLQERRDELELRVNSNNEQLSRIKSKQKVLIDEGAFLVLSSDMFVKCSALVDDNRKKGILPYGIKEQFIDDRIELGSCICGTTITPNSQEHKCLLEVRKTAGTDNQESVYTCVSALLNGQEEIVERFNRDYKEYSEDLGRITIDTEEARKEFNEISAQLIQLDDKKITLLEAEHLRTTNHRDNAVSDKGIAQNSSIDAVAKLDDYNKRLIKLEDDQARQTSTNRRMSLATVIAETLTELRESLSDQVRVDLSARVDEIFQSIIRKPIRAIIDDEYRLQILKKSTSGEEHPVNEQSTGERQVTSLSFISSIISLAKEKHSKRSTFFQGGLYPLVMDSPFGSLDDDYREKVAQNISVLAEQVIIFVSNSQWEGKVKLACSDRVGKSYKLIYHSPKKPKSGNNAYTVHSGNGLEYSTIEEVLL